MCPLQAQPHCSSVKQGTNVTSTKDDVLDVLLRRENHLCLADFLHFSLNRVISHGKITANHPKSHQHPEVLRNLVLAQLYVYALIQLFSRLDARSLTPKIRIAVTMLGLMGHEHNVCRQTLRIMVVFGTDF